MNEKTPQNLPWLDRLNVHIPSYSGYERSAHRVAADAALREAVAQRLDLARSNIDEAIRVCNERNATSEVGSLQRIAEHFQHVAQRVRTASTVESDFTEAGDFGPAKADTLHALDHALLDRADNLIALTRQQGKGHDWLAKIEQELNGFEQKLDVRAMMHKHFR